MWSRSLYAFALVTAMSVLTASGCLDDVPLDDIRLPPGFSIDLYSGSVPGARSMTMSPSGVLYVGTRDDRVYAVVDGDGDHHADKVYIVAKGLEMPNGVAFRDGSLYVAEVYRVIRFDNIESDLANPPKPAVVNDTFPTDTHHGWKFIAFGPDGLLYVPVGAPCNICDPGDPYAAILRMKPDGTGLEIFARGVRNTVGFDWDPKTGYLWFTDNGRDWMGDDLPPDELNCAPRPGMNFGYPFFHGDEIPDPEYGKGKSPDGYTPPEMDLGAHVAPLGMRFYEGNMFPPEYNGNIFIAEHGSWNRSIPVGYRVMLVRLKDGRAVSKEPFAVGWKSGMNGWGRPVDVQVMPDGSLLVSDDRKGVIYRISYTE